MRKEEREMTALQASSIATIVKFGYPATLVRDFGYWTVLARPQQVTLGALVVCSKEPVTSFADLSAEAFAELKQIATIVEHGLRALWHFDKINYLMLMMVDSDVHFHVVPRYAAGRAFEGIACVDAGWPAVPRLDAVNAIDGAAFETLVARLRVQCAPAPIQPRTA
jgi:diadenosine tetraphosphate (Ap4A) HIT family hydrolase